ncbi:MAG: DUF2860 family protein [Desulfobacterales bacterium]
MVSQKLLIVAAVVVFLLAGTNAVLALDPIPQKSGFSGYIQPGLGYLSIKSNMVAKVLSFDLSDKKINNLSNESDSESSAIFTIPYKLAYTFAGTRTELFLGTELGDLLAFDTAQQLGIKQGAGALGVFQAGFLFSDRVKVWRDPYVTGSNRDTTGRKNMGGQVVWDKVFGHRLLQPGGGSGFGWSGFPLEVGQKKPLAAQGRQRKWQHDCKQHPLGKG